MDSTLANIYLSVSERLKEEVPELRWIDQDFGQLDIYKDGTRPAVAFPCTLIDNDEIDYSDTSEQEQIAERAVLIIKTGYTNYSDAAAGRPTLHKEKALEYYNLEHKINSVLHGWCDDRFFSPLARKKAYTEKRLDGIRVRIIRYEFSFVDNSAVPVRTTVPRPELEIKPEVSES